MCQYAWRPEPNMVMICTRPLRARRQDDARAVRNAVMVLACRMPAGCPSWENMVNTPGSVRDFVFRSMPVRTAPVSFDQLKPPLLCSLPFTPCPSGQANGVNTVVDPTSGNLTYTEFADRVSALSMAGGDAVFSRKDTCRAS